SLSAPLHFDPLSLHDALPISLCSFGTEQDVHRSRAHRVAGNEDRIQLEEALELLDEAALRIEPGFDAASYRPPIVTGLDPESGRSEEHTSELQSRSDLVCRLL